MAATPGKAASLTWSGLTLLLSSWNLDNGVDMMEITAFSDAGVEKMLAGVARWTVSATGAWDVGNTTDVGDTATLTLTPVSGSTWTGTAFLASINATSTVAEPNMATYNFVGSGALTPPS